MNLQVMKNDQANWIVIENSGMQDEYLHEAFYTLPDALAYIDSTYTQEERKGLNIQVAYLTDSLDLTYDY